MLNKKDVVREQFDKQAKQFSNWIGTRDERSLQQLFDFIGFAENDSLLDVGCGTGNFAAFCANRIGRVHGVDISPKMIDLARKQVEANKLNNVFFECHDVEDLPFEVGGFSVVTSRSAFHHMEHYDKVFQEMVRCCQDGGLVCIDDVAAYDDPQANFFFDELDRAIDVSHNTRISANSFRDLFALNGVEILRSADLEFEISVQLYASHAVQSEDAARKIHELLQFGLKDPKVSKFLYREKDDIVFKNKGFRVVGRK